MKPRKLLLPFLICVSLSGCVTMPTGPGVTMAPNSGKPFNVFLSEFKKCKELADRQMGNYSDYISSEEAQAYYDKAYVNCMISYGNRIQQPVRGNPY
jgi:hypothetical protein